MLLDRSGMPLSFDGPTLYDFPDILPTEVNSVPHGEVDI
jgi:hypothetical protein